MLASFDAFPRDYSSQNIENSSSGGGGGSGNDSPAKVLVYKSLGVFVNVHVREKLLHMRLP